MTVRWTQAAMRAVAEEERTGLGLTPAAPLDPYLLAAEHGIPVYPLEILADGARSDRAVRHFLGGASAAWSAALVPIGGARVIIENTTHAPWRRRSSIAHELGHHLLEHEFDEVLLTGEGCRRFDPRRERQATFLAGELLVPWIAARRAAFDGTSDQALARRYGVSEQFARMRTAGPRVLARRALAKQYGYPAAGA
ncbi:MAG TPA: ImmA/IrrE family metallo-endopeptidase [Pseudonocardiaceae bacterium]